MCSDCRDGQVLTLVSRWREIKYQDFGLTLESLWMRFSVVLENSNMAKLAPNQYLLA
jgi:hypothetical protein